ncbi:hypothetical protein CF640_36915, partial [Burkholderia pseudomallei]
MSSVRTFPSTNRRTTIMALPDPVEYTPDRGIAEARRPGRRFSPHSRSAARCVTRQRTATRIKSYGAKRS